MGTHGPIQEHYREQMRALASAIDELFNGNEEPKKVGFALLMFDFGETPTSDRINYISNSRREDMVCALKELLARWEGRHIEETETPLPTEAQ